MTIIIRFDYNVDAKNLRSGMPDVFLPITAKVDENFNLTFCPPPCHDVINEEKMWREITRLAWKHYHEAMDAIEQKINRIQEGARILKGIPESDEVIYPYKLDLVSRISIILFYSFLLTLIK